MGTEDNKPAAKWLLREGRGGRLYARAFGGRASEIAQGAFEVVQVRQDVARADGP